MEFNSLEINNKKIKSILIIIIFFGILFPLNSSYYFVSGVSTWTQTSEKDFEDGISKNLTIKGNGEDAELQISDLKLWSKQIPGGNLYPRLWYAMSSMYSEDKVIIFGGKIGSNDYKNDTWIYDVSDNIWSQKTPNNNPSAKGWTTMAPVFGTKKVVLFGGYDGGLINDTWVYDLNNNSWTNMTPINHPQALCQHAMASVYGQDKVILYGGSLQSGYSNETWVYDLSDNNWTLQSPANNPGSMVSHSMTNIWGTDKAILYTSGINPGETWEYDLSLDNWTSKIPKYNPPSRTFTSISTISGTDNIFLFGGYVSPSNYLGDTWKYDFSDNNWTQLIPKNPNNKPSKRHAHNYATVDGTNKVVLFGGWSSPNIVNNDTWIYRHPPIKNGTYVSGPYNTGSKSDFKTISWFANIPENTTLKFQIRSAINESLLANEPFVGPDGVGSSFYTSSPSDIWSEHDGDRWVQFIAYFSVKMVIHSPVLKYVTISYNCLPNIIVVSPVNNILTSNNKPTFKWTFEDFDSTKQKAFQVLIDDELTFSNVDFDSGEQNTAEEKWAFPTGTNYTELPDGVYHWKVRTKDADGAWTEFSSPREIRIDSHAPSSALNFPSNNGFYNNVLEISGIANDGATGSGLNRVEINIKRSKDNNYWNGTEWVQWNTWLLATGTTNWTYDSSKLVWISGARYSIQCRAIDNATNIEQTNIMNIFTIDEDNPKSTIESPMDNNWLNKLKIISGSSFDMAGSGINKVEICIKCSNNYNSYDDGPKKDNYWNGITWTSKKVWLLASGTKEWSYDTAEIPFSTGDHYTIFSRAIDKTNNLEVPGLGTTFMYDSISPDNVGININNDDEHTESSSVTLSLQAEDIGSGLSEMSFSLSQEVWSAWELFNFTRSFELPTGDGKKIVYFRIKDFAGNIAELVSDTILLDTTPPEQLDIVINDNAKYTNSRRIKLDLMAIDKLSGVDVISLSYNEFDWFEWEPFNQTRYLNVPESIVDGEIRIFFKAKDKVGNVAEPNFDSIILDTKLPHSLSILINDGAQETNLTMVTLNLQAFDNTSEISQMSLASDGESWSDWEEFKEVKSYDLIPGNGEKIIYFKVKDKAGNVAGPVSGIIILNITTPQKEVQVKETPSTGYNFWMIMFILAIIFFIMIIIGFVIINKQKKPADQDLLPPGALTNRPGGLSGPQISMAQITKVMEQPQLPSAIESLGSQEIRAGSEITPTPMLAKSTQISQSKIPQTIIKLPALPPAKHLENKPEVSPTTQTPVPTVVSPPSIPTPTKVPSISPGSVVHLPKPNSQTIITTTAQPKTSVDDSISSVLAGVPNEITPTPLPQVIQQPKNPNESKPKIK
jgi:hypothetical protein